MKFIDIRNLENQAITGGIVGLEDYEMLRKKTLKNGLKFWLGERLIDGESTGVIILNNGLVLETPWAEYEGLITILSRAIALEPGALEMVPMEYIREFGEISSEIFVQYKEKKLMDLDDLARVSPDQDFTQFVEEARETTKKLNADLDKIEENIKSAGLVKGKHVNRGLNK